MSEKAHTLDQICFVISTIGREGTEIHQKFREVLDFVIKPAVEQLGFKLQVLRADDIERSGSFIKDILEYVSSAFIVIADLTDQNPNVFYELGVRHSLSPRTILIAQTLEDIPSDLREYRTIIYDMSAKGAAVFRQRIEKYLNEIRDDPQRPDNPVMDKLGSVIESRTRELETEVAQLKSQLDSVLRKGVSKERHKPKGKEPLGRRLDRILSLIDADRNVIGRVTIFDEEDRGRSYIVPSRRGDFELYELRKSANSDLLYIATVEGKVGFEKELADLRVLMEECSRRENFEYTFIIISDEDLSDKKQVVLTAFEKIKNFIRPDFREHLKLEIWDENVLLEKEKELGIKVDLSGIS